MPLEKLPRLGGAHAFVQRLVVNALGDTPPAGGSACIFDYTIWCQCPGDTPPAGGSAAFNALGDTPVQFEEMP